MLPSIFINILPMCKDAGAYTFPRLGSVNHRLIWSSREHSRLHVCAQALHLCIICANIGTRCCTLSRIEANHQPCNGKCSTRLHSHNMPCHVGLHVRDLDLGAECSRRRPQTPQTLQAHPAVPMCSTIIGFPFLVSCAPNEFCYTNRYLTLIDQYYHLPNN